MSSKVAEANAKIHSLAMAVAVSLSASDYSLFGMMRWNILSGIYSL